MYGVNEIFQSVQGEGLHTGSLATFIRLQGCPVGCKWCDSVRTWASSNKRTDAFVRGYVAKDPPTDNFEEQRGWVAKVLDTCGNEGFITPEVGQLDAVIEILNKQGAGIDKNLCPEGAIFVDIVQAQQILNYFQPESWRPYKLKMQTFGSSLTVKQIVERIVKEGLRSPHYIITGGEPLIYDLDDLIAGIRSRLQSPFIQIETSGLNGFKGKMLPDWITWSPKENLQWSAPTAFRAFVDEVKWVVDDKLPWDVFEKTSMEIISVSRGKVVLMPEGCPPRDASIKKAMEMQRRLYRIYPLLRNDSVVVCDRMQYRLGVK